MYCKTVSTLPVKATQLTTFRKLDSWHISNIGMNSSDLSSLEEMTSAHHHLFLYFKSKTKKIKAPAVKAVLEFTLVCFPSLITSELGFCLLLATVCCLTRIYVIPHMIFFFSSTQGRVGDTLTCSTISWYRMVLHKSPLRTFKSWKGGVVSSHSVDSISSIWGL